MSNKSRLLNEFTYVAVSKICRQPNMLMRAFGMVERGLFTKIPIKADSLIGEYEGRQVSMDEVNEEQIPTTYIIWTKDPQGKLIGVVGENKLRFSNHSKKPNMKVVGNLFYALQDIPAEEELTWNYGDFDY